MAEKLVPLSGHAVFLLLVQLSLLLVVARAGAELAKRVSLPAVVGELAAGIALGPSLFGHYWPAAFQVAFPHVSQQFQLLDVVGTLGMTLLLLLTGLETDLRLLRNLGRAALIASATGMALPFVLGFGLGWLLPPEFLAQPDERVLFSLFLATAMSISAMPVIAKILMDLDLTKRNIGLVILSAGVVDDTAGWIVLSLIAGAATHGGLGAAQLGPLARTLGLTLGFIVVVAFVLYPMARWAMRAAVESFRSRDSDLVLMIVLTFLCAAATEWIGIHAVFGAFVCGAMLRQVPSVKADTIHRLEGFVFAVLAPIFFGIVGLKVDLWGMGGIEVPLIVLGVACVGKLVGCSLGALWGGLRFWEAASIAVAMNARGAMELVVATIGLSLGILNDAMFSIIVMVAVVTSFIAPLGLRLTMRMVRMTEEEARRINAEQARGVFDPARVRVLVPTAGGPNALGAARLAFVVARKSESPVTVMFVEQRVSRWERLKRAFVKNPAGQGLEQHLDAIRKLADGARAPDVRLVTSDSVAGAIIDEARRHDLVVIGASQHATSIGGDVLAEVVEGAPCHVAVVKTADARATFRHLLVPVDGSLVSRIAVEFAARYSEVSAAELTLALLTEHRPQAAAYSDDEGGGEEDSVTPVSDEDLARVSLVFRAVERKPNVLRLDYDPSSSALADEVATGTYDLIVIGAENRAVQNRLFFGYDNERLIRSSHVSVAVVVPHVGRLAR